LYWLIVRNVIIIIIIYWIPKDHIAECKCKSLHARTIPIGVVTTNQFGYTVFLLRVHSSVSIGSIQFESTSLAWSISAFIGYGFILAYNGSFQLTIYGMNWSKSLLNISTFRWNSEEFVYYLGQKLIFYWIMIGC
jgi:hypothetical protein